MKAHKYHAKATACRQGEVEEVRAALNYDPETGEFTWREKIADKVVIGTRAGSLTGAGYRQISVGARHYLEHRLAFLWMTGRMPALVDHKNRNKSDNRWKNLRAADKRLNALNSCTPVTNTSGFKGVSRNGNAWSASFKVNGKKIHLGTFATPELAHEKYRQAILAAGGEFARSA